MSLATLSIDLVAKLAELQQGMDKAGRIAERSAAQIEARFGKMTTLAKGIGGAFLAAVPIAGLSRFVSAANDGLLAIKDLSEATGASISNISALENIARDAGGSLQEVSGVLIKFNGVLKDADGKNGVSQALKAIGLDAAELRRLDPAEALRRTAVALAQFEDDGNKARITQELFGKGVKEATGVLNDLAEAGELVGRVTKEQVEEADKYNKQLGRLRAVAEDAARAVSGPLVEGLNQFFDAINGRGVGGSSAITDLVTVPLQTAAVVGANVAFVFRGIGTEIGGIAAQAAAVARLDFSGAGAIGRAMKEDAAAARAEFDALERRLMSIGRALPQADYSNEGRLQRPRLAALSDATKPTPVKARKASTEFVGPLMPESLERALKLIDNVDSAKIRELREQLASLISIRATSGGGAVDEAILGVEEALARLDPAQQQAIANQERLNQILSNTPSGQLSGVLEEIEFINAQFSAGKIAEVEQWAEAVRNATAKLPAAAEPELEKISTFAEQAGRNIQDALGDTLLATMSGSSQSIGRIWTDLLKRMVAQAAAVQLGKALLGDNFSKSGQIGGAIGGFLSLFDGARADGGPVMAGRAYLVGERGPEMIVPRGAGTVIPNNQLGGGGNTFQVVVQGDASENTIRLIRGALSQFEARMMSQARYA